ncbi:MAG TPA: thioredoxin domain-containing protein [Terriglobales bacterium]|nr:thioredoxin domain-containing protein [Terriglobales bacterium]
MSVLKRAMVLVALLCLGCAAQTNAGADVDRRIEKQLRNEAELSPAATVKVGPHKPSDFGGWDEVTVAVNDQGEQKTYTFLLSKDGKTLVHYTRFDISTDPNQRTMAKIDLTGRPVRGSQDAKVTVAVYDDFQCPYCARMYDTLFNDVMKRYGDRVKVVYKDYPLYQIHPWAVRAALDSNCLLQQSNDAFWQFSDRVHATQHEISAQEEQPDPKPAKDSKDPKDAKKDAPKIRTVGLDKLTFDIAAGNKLDMTKLQACLATRDLDRVQKSLNEGKQLGVNATPTLFVNGERLEGALTPEELEAALDRALTDAGVPVPAKPTPAPAPATK